MRLIFCNACRTLEECPDYEGSLAIDPLVEGIVMKHNERDPMGHGGSQLTASPMRIFHVDDETWNDEDPDIRERNRTRVYEQIRGENKQVGFDAWAYEAMSTYEDDALRCYRDHHRPTEGCIDFWDDSKRLGRPTPEGQQAVKERYKLGKKDPHLCQFCPVFTYVQTRMNMERGLYDA